ncbi:alpha/beta hydrolase [Novosphingobium sp. 9]|uniref:alpha/beta hydrolase n=1 Tax=Novosphingobium sp. 9 TaxID=2025349 RepID=UPI0021B6128E|nr:alpha/beta hydrolase [Novosphingobium sp. 9]
MANLGRRGFVAACGTLGAGALPYRAIAKALTATPADDLSAVDPELRPLAETFLKQREAGPPLSLANLAQARAAGLQNAPAALPDVPYLSKRIPVPDNPPGKGGEVTVYVINSTPGASRPAILHVHGGGFISGSPLSDLRRLQQLAHDLRLTIVSVDYDLAPEARYQRSIEQNYAALKWTYDHAADLGIDRQRIAVLGGSAGGGHAAILAIVARDRGEVPLCFQCLIYPMLDDRTGTTRHPAAPIGKLIWTEDNNRLGWSSFLGQQPGGPTVPAVPVPARCRDLRGLPPTFIGVGSIDLFVDEDIDYARRLIDAGVPTQLVVVPGAYHGFEELVPQARISQRFTQMLEASLKTAFKEAGDK